MRHTVKDAISPFECTNRTIRRYFNNKASFTSIKFWILLEALFSAVARKTMTEIQDDTSSSDSDSHTGFLHFEDTDSANSYYCVVEGCFTSLKMQIKELKKSGSRNDDWRLSFDFTMICHLIDIIKNIGLFADQKNKIESLQSYIRYHQTLLLDLHPFGRILRQTAILDEDLLRKSHLWVRDLMKPTAGMRKFASLAAEVMILIMAAEKIFGLNLEMEHQLNEGLWTIPPRNAEWLETQEHITQVLERYEDILGYAIEFTLGMEIDDRIDETENHLRTEWQTSYLPSVLKIGEFGNKFVPSSSSSHDGDDDRDDRRRECISELSFDQLDSRFMNINMCELIFMR
jgi:hypothetical protein